MLPDGERQRIPEGPYSFQILSEPEKRGHTSQATGKKFLSIKFELKATDSNGDEFHVYESMLTFDDKYIDLLIALGAKEVKGKMSGQTIEPVGMMFKGEIVHEKDKNDSSKTYTRIQNIQAVDDLKDEEVPIAPPVEDDDSIPF